MRFNTKDPTTNIMWYQPGLAREYVMLIFARRGEIGTEIGISLSS